MSGLILLPTANLYPPSTTTPQVEDDDEAAADEDVTKVIFDNEEAGGFVIIDEAIGVGLTVVASANTAVGRHWTELGRTAPAPPSNEEARFGMPPLLVALVVVGMVVIIPIKELDNEASLCAMFATKASNTLMSDNILVSAGGGGCCAGSSSSRFPLLLLQLSLLLLS